MLAGEAYILATTSCTRAPLAGVISIFIFCGVGEKRRVGHGGIERLAQYRHPFWRCAGRQFERPAEHLLPDDEIEHAPAVLVLDVAPQRRHALGGEARVLVGRHLQDHVHAVVLHPVGLVRGEARPVEPADAVDLALLHRQRDVDAALVAADDLELGANLLVEEIGDSRTASRPARRRPSPSHVSAHPRRCASSRSRRSRRRASRHWRCRDTGTRSA